ncbi:MAG: hypothetical protein M3487_08330 [Actinomycetota bacterium]|nr:hypothetical protein [Actinomycetota bacterium]
MPASRPATAVGSVAERKRELRKEMRAIRAAIAVDPVQRAARSGRIWERIVTIAELDVDRLVAAADRVPVRRVMLFDGLATEPDTGSWLAWCGARELGVFTPRVDGADLRVVPGDVDPQLLDVVVVPGLAFTVDGRRVGQGGGHYDRFLPRLREDCLTIGACFAEQVVADVPIEPHDQRVDAVATDAPEVLPPGRGSPHPRMP